MMLPIWMMITGSFMGAAEVSDNIGAVFSYRDGFVKWSVLPLYPTIKPYIELLGDTPEFFHLFWNSCLQVFPILLGFLLVAVPGAWAFGVYEFPMKKLLFFLYTVLMILPFQVTMASNYLVIHRLDLMDSELAVILPAVFSTFPVFIMTKFFSSIPRSLFEAAEVDGAGEFQIFLRIGINMGLPGIISALVLGFLEAWNAVEQPLIYIRTQSKWPLSLQLPNITTGKAGISFAASVVTMLPALMIFLIGQSYLEEGIQASGIKE
jgi:multiple sugar transport system permease protein